MRIGVNSLFLIPGEVGGSESYLTETLFCLMKEYPESPFILFTNRENHDFFYERLRDFPHLELIDLNFAASNRFVRITLEQTKLPAAARKARLDLLWSPGYTSPIFCPCPQVVSILDMQYKHFPGDLTPVARLTSDFLIKSAGKRANALIAISEFSKNEIVTFLKVPPDRIWVTPLAVNEAFSEKTNDEDRKKLTQSLLGFDAPYIFCVANTYQHKNLPSLIKAFGQLDGEFPHHLLVVGKPGLGEGDVEKAVAESPNAKRIKRIRYVSQKDLIALYQEADLFVFPSLYEGFGLPVLEAMAAGVPVIASKNGSIPEVGGDVVRYFDTTIDGDLTEAVRDMLRLSSDERAKWIVRAQKRAETFSWQQTAKITMECFQYARKGTPPGKTPSDVFQ